MKENKTGAVLAGLEAVAAVFMILAVKVIAPVCTGMLETVAGKQVHMKCFYTSQVLVLVGVLLLVNAIVGFAAKNKFVSGVMAVAIAVVVFVVLNDTMGIGICANPDMACNLTVPYVKVCATLTVIVGAVSAYLGLKEVK